MVAQSHPDATVLVLSPSFAGTHSQVFDRVTLEAGEDLAKTGNPVQSAQNFVDQLNTPISHGPGSRSCLPSAYYWPRL